MGIVAAAALLAATAAWVTIPAKARDDTPSP
jgi:hypothetical protein